MLIDCPFRIAVIAAATLMCACSGARLQQQPAANNQPAAERKRADSCSLLTENEIAEAVGNAVDKGQVQGNADICKWGTEDPSKVDVLLIVREKGGIHEPVLCADVRSNTTDEHLPGLGEVAVWKFSRQPFFNSGDLEVCGPKGYLTMTLNGKRDEAALKAAATNLAQKILSRL